MKISLLDLADPPAGHPAWAWAMRGVESLGEPAVPVRFGAPATSVGAGGQGPGVDALGGEDGQVAGVGAEAGTMLADVGIRAGALCLGAQAVAAGQPRLDGGVWGLRTWVRRLSCGFVGSEGCRVHAKAARSGWGS